MSDWFSSMVDVQREMLRAQKAQMDAAQKMLDAGQDMLDAGKDVAKLQDAGQKAAEANLALWKQWSRFWGIK